MSATRRALLVLLALCPMGSLATERIEVHRDARGVLHLSNIGHAPPASALAAGARPTRSLAVVLQAPPAIAIGDVLEVVITIPESVGMRGELSLQYDPQSLALREASGDVEPGGAGELVLLVDPHIDRVFSTVLAFDVHGAADAVTRIRVRTGALESELGERIGLDLPGAVETRIGSGG